MYAGLTRHSEGTPKAPLTACRDSPVLLYIQRIVSKQSRHACHLVSFTLNVICDTKKIFYMKSCSKGIYN